MLPSCNPLLMTASSGTRTLRVYPVGRMEMREPPKWQAPDPAVSEGTIVNDSVPALGSGGESRTRSASGRAATDVSQPRHRARRASRIWAAHAIRLLFVANLAIIVDLWLRDGGIAGINSLGTLLTSIGRITGLLGAYALLIQLLLLARLPFLEWVASFDRLTTWHKVNGKITLHLILAHVGFITLGYALMNRLSVPTQLQVLLRVYPGMLAGFAGTILLILVVISSIVAVRRRLRYQTWFLIHLMAYSAVALAWFHQSPPDGTSSPARWRQRSGPPSTSPRCS